MEAKYREKEIIKFDMTACLEAFSLLLDYAEMDYFKIHLNHARRVAYISLCVGKALNLNPSDMSDLFALALLHDNGVTLAGISSSKFELNPEHCEVGEKNTKVFPFIEKRENVIKFHHENYDGSSFFGISGEDVPLLAQIIRLSDKLDTTFDVSNIKADKRSEVKEFAATNKRKAFSPDVVNAFLLFAEKERFWADLAFYDTSEIVRRIAPKIIYDYRWDDIFPISETFMRVVDAKSRFTYRHSLYITKRIAVMADFYNFDEAKKEKIQIAANLHDLGKLYVSNTILEKPAVLSHAEFSEMKKHAYFTKLVIEKIPGFQEIAGWASNHHEKLNGKGYPEGLKGEEIDFESRLMGVVDIYQALTENRPYRKGSSHKESVLILNQMANGNFIDRDIVKDADNVFAEIKL